MQVTWIPILVGLLPVISVNVCYVISSQLGHIPLCNPYLEGCTSISSAGRIGPETYIFKGTIIPTAMLMMGYWILSYRWLVCMGDKHSRSTRAIPYLGIIAAVFLILYATVLGSIGEVYAMQRRLGVTIFFAFTFLAQLLMTARIHKMHSDGNLALPAYIPRLFLGMGILLLAIGLTSGPLSLVAKQADNIVEWNFAVLMYLYFLPTYLLWRETGFTIRFSIQNK